MLDGIGLNAEHTSVYRLILAVPSASPADVARDAGVSEARVHEVIDHLESLGLLARQASAPDRLVASPPALALGPLVAEHERRVAQAQATIVELSELYREGAALRETPDVVDMVLGGDAVRQRLGQLQASALNRVRAFVLSDVALVTATENVEEDRALARGVRYQVIVEQRVLERPGFIENARQDAMSGEEIRVLPSLPTRLFIIDEDVALLPMRTMGDSRAAGALLLHPSGLLDLVSAIFDEYWASATGFLSDSEMPSDHDAVDRDLLKLLLLGLTDAAVGTQLGISLRTVQRRIAELMQTAGVITRMQLGAEAVRRGWV